MSLSEPGRESVIKAIQGNPDNPVRFVTCRILNHPQITVFKILAILSDSFWQKIRYLVSTYLPTYLQSPQGEVILYLWMDGLQFYWLRIQ